MNNKLESLVRLSVLLLTGLLLSATLPSCKATRCDCPEFGGHRLKH